MHLDFGLHTEADFQITEICLHVRLGILQGFPVRDAAEQEHSIICFEEIS